MGNITSPFYQSPFPIATPQLSYQTQFNLPLPGSVADGALVQDFVTGIASVDIPFGLFVARDVSSGDANVKLPSAAGDVAIPAGFVIRTGAIESRRDSKAPGYLATDPINLMRAGRMIVSPEDVVAKGGSVYVRVTAGSAGTAAFTQLGTVRSEGDGGKCILLPGAKFGSSNSAAGEQAIVEFNFLGL